MHPTNLHNLISELRTVLRDDEHHIIQTKHGVGFSFAGQAFIDDARTPAPQIVVGEEMHELRQGENIIGRDHTATVRIQAASVSRLHARIVVAGRTATLEDLGSKNGTFLRGQRLRAAAPLSDGDELVFGSVAARFLLAESLSTESLH